MKRRRNPQRLTDAFWAWFGESKIKDQNGKPLVVYHGTRSPVDFQEFTTGAVLNDLDETILSGSEDPNSYLGPHFALEASVASKFASGRAADWDRTRYVSGEGASVGGRVIPCFVKITNPFVFDDEDDLTEWIFEHGISAEIERQIEFEYGEDDETLEGVDFDDPDIKREAFDAISRDDEEGNLKSSAASELGWSAKSQMITLGYDGVVYKNNVEGGTGVIPLLPGCVKSAISNSGRYDSESDDIFE